MKKNYIIENTLKFVKNWKSPVPGEKTNEMPTFWGKKYSKEWLNSINIFNQLQKSIEEYILTLEKNKVPEETGPPLTQYLLLNTYLKNR